MIERIWKISAVVIIITIFAGAIVFLISMLWEIELLKEIIFYAFFGTLIVNGVIMIAGRFIYDGRKGN